MVFEKYICGEEKNSAYEAIYSMMAEYDLGLSYADMMRLRISGKLKDECHDVYYVAHEGGKGVSRHWMGYGKHKDAIGNWGNFYTDPDYRRQGLGAGVLNLWLEDLKTTEHKPLCFLCTGGALSLAQRYAQFGFRPAIRGKEFGPLYMPVGDSPDTFLEFCENYYKPSPVIFHRPATIEYRHEIDCLLRFYAIDNELDLSMDGVKYAEEGLLYQPGKTGMLFSEDGHCIGWSFGGKIRLHPLYKNSEIVNQSV